MESSNFEAEIKKEIKAAIDFQQAQIQSVIRYSKARNEYLSQQISTHTQVEPHNFPDYPNPPSHDLIEQYYEARRNLLLAQKNRERLIQVQDHLTERIAYAKEILQKEQQEKRNRSIYSFSRTVARLKGIPNPQASSNQFSRYNSNNNDNSNSSKYSIIESTVFEDQLEAIKALKNGARPRQYGEVKYDFDNEMDLLSQEIERVKSKNSELLGNISTNINNFLNDSTAIQNEIAQRQNDMSSFQNFAQAYYNSNNEIEKLKYTKLSQVLKTVRNDVQNKRFDELYSHLNSEKEMIEKQLSSLGAGDFETNKLKSEIEFQMLYLGHLTAIAGGALSKISTEKQPADPIEEMRAEIVSMRHKLPKYNSA